METAFESDPLLRLLTDALRRGPGSPEWHRALAEVKTAASAQGDEYQLLLSARERLESGRAYREVRAGPGFTRDLLGALDAEPGRAKAWSAGLVLRLGLLLVAVAALGYVVMRIAQSGPGDAQRLSGRLFVTREHDWTFASMPRDLKTTGPLPLEARNGLRPSGRNPGLPATGVVYADGPLDLARGTCVEMRLEYKPNAGGASLLLLKAPAAPGGTIDDGSRIALACDAAGAQLRASLSASAPRPLAAGSHLLRLKVVGDDAAAEVDGQTIWTGRHALGPRAYVGIGIDRAGRGEDVVVQSLRVLAP